MEAREVPGCVWKEEQLCKGPEAGRHESQQSGSDLRYQDFPPDRQV